jgi:hypothetical protein
MTSSAKLVSANARLKIRTKQQVDGESFMVRLTKVLVAMGLALLAAACGGGGGGGGGQQGSRGTLSVSTTSLTFIANGPTAPTPAPQTISGSVTGLSGGTLVINVVGTGTAIAAISPVILTSDTTGQATVSVPPPAQLGVGTYTGTITVRACTGDPNCASGNLNGSPQTINVTYHVAALQSSSAAFDYTIMNSPAANDLARQATITGVPAQSWTATTNANWLSVTANGANGATLNANLVQTALDALVNGSYTGTVTLTPGTAGQPLVIPVSLTVKRTQINNVAPYVAYTGTSKEVIVRGDEFQQVTVGNVLFGTTPATAFTVVSPTEIRATYPNTLPKGHHNVKLQSAFTARSFADLAVVDAPTFTATKIDYPNAQLEAAPSVIVYDAERAALGVSVHFNDGGTALLRYSFVNGVWQAPDQKSLFNNFGVTLTGDGTEWIAGVNNSVVHLSAADLSTVAEGPPLGLQYPANFATASNGKIVFFSDVTFSCGATLVFYDARKRVFTQPGFAACRGNLGMSGDGSRAILLNQFPEFSTDDVLTLNTDSGVATPSGIHMFTGKPPALSRDGSRMVLDRTQVRDGSFNALGNLPSTTDGVVLSPDGTRAYAYDHSGKFITYDLTAPTVVGVFPPLGSPVTLVGDPGPMSTTPAFSDEIVMMTITPDGKAVFIAGDKAIIVQPTPP